MPVVPESLESIKPMPLIAATMPVTITTGTPTIGSMEPTIKPKPANEVLGDLLMF